MESSLEPFHYMSLRLKNLKLRNAAFIVLFVSIRSIVDKVCQMPENGGEKGK